MRDLFTQWRRGADLFSHRAVAAYMKELPDYQRFLADPRARAEMVDFGVFLRERTVSHIAEDGTFTGDDLDVVVAAGLARGAAGMSPASHRHALHLHTSLTLREVHEAARPDDLTDLMHALRALPLLGLAAQKAFTTGFLRGQRTHLPVAARVRVLVDLLLAGDPMAADLAQDLAMPVPERCVVLVARVSGAPPRDEIEAELLARHWVPLSWQEQELVALVGAAGTVDTASTVGAAGAVGAVGAEDRAAAVAADLGQLVGVPCAVGAAAGTVADLAGTLARARQVSQVAPLVTPSTVYYQTDLFAELAVTHVPRVEEWLRTVARRLADGPALVTTLDSFYRNGMSRTLTAAALGVHPRTLDYRLRRVHELTGLDPSSVRGVRVLSTTATRVLSGGWD